jgi:MFS family permease
LNDDESSTQQGLVSRIRREFDFIQGNFLYLIISWFIIDFVVELPSTYFPLYVKALGGTATSLGIIMASTMISMSFVQLLGGYIADKYGRKWIITIMTVIAGLGRLIYVLAPTWEWLIIAGIIIGVSLIYGPALQAMVADSLPSEKRGIGYGLVHLITSASTTPAPLIAGYLFLRMGLVPSVRLCYGIATIGFLIAAMIRTRLKETVESPERINVREMIESYPTSIKESMNVWEHVPKDAFALFTNKVGTSFSAGIMMPVSTLFIIDDLGISELELSIILSSMFVTMILFALPTGKLVDIVGKKKPLLFGYIIWGISVPLFLYGNFWRLFVVMTLWGALRVLIRSARSAWNADLVSIENRGKVNGSSYFYSLIALSLGQLIGGWVYDNLGHSTPVILQAVFMIPPFLIILLKTKEPPIHEPN